MRGTVTEFSDERGLGRVRSDEGTEYLFHVIEIADGTRAADVGQLVTFHPLPKFGAFEAGHIVKV